MIVVNDNQVCPKCGAYSQNNGYCCNGHPVGDSEWISVVEFNKNQIVKIEEFGYKFDHQLNDVNSKIEELVSQYPNFTKDDFIEFLNEKTEWNICDSCGKIEKSENLYWLDSDDFYDEDYQTQKFINAFTANDAVCSDCFKDFGKVTFLDLDTIRDRLKENNQMFRVGEKIFIDLSRTNKTYVEKFSSEIAMRVFTIKETTSEGYIVDGTDQIIKDFMTFDMVNYALCNKFADVVDEYTDRIDEYDELNSFNWEGQLEINHALEDYGLKEEFKEYLKKNDFEDFLKYIKEPEPKVIQRNIYQIEDGLVQNAIRYLGHSLKYLFETGRRDKLGNDKPYAFWYYQSYLANFYLLHGLKLEDIDNMSSRFTPSKFFSKMISTDDYFDINDIVRELLEAVSFYMHNKTGNVHKITFLPFYFNESFENSPEANFADYVFRDLIMNKKYTAKEIREMTLSETYIN
jgi:hypothetical protein